MANWFSQQERASVTATTVKRTLYLRAFEDEVSQAIENYFLANPYGDEVTLAVFLSIGEKRLTKFTSNKSLHRLKQDIGLLVAQLLVERFGASRVLTYRTDDGVNVSTRTANWPGLEWVNRYTPHRVMFRDQDRILLDTNVIRSIIHGDKLALNLDELTQLKGGHLVSIPDPAFAELALALIQERLPFSLWSKKIAELDKILDPQLPVTPGGRDLTAFCQVKKVVGFNQTSVRSFYQASWRFLASAASVDDLQRKMIYDAPDGQRYKIGPLTKSALEIIVNEAGQHWLKFIDCIANLVRTCSPRPNQEQIADLIRSHLAVNMESGNVDKLDLVVRTMAHRAWCAAEGTHAYSPKSNDAIDWSILFAIPLPAVICTSDGPFYSVAKASGSADSKRVMKPDDLMCWLRNERQNFLGTSTDS